MRFPLRNAFAVLLFRPPFVAFYWAFALFYLVYLFANQVPPQNISSDSFVEELQIEESETIESESGAELLIADEISDLTLAIVAPEAPPEESWLEYRVRRGDTMARVLSAINTDSAMRDYLLPQDMKTYRRLRVKSIVYFQKDADGNLQKLLYKTDPKYYFSAGRDAAGNLWVKEEAPVTTKARYQRGGVIDSSLFAATDAAGISEAASSKLVQVLETQINFYRDVRKGDNFRVIYETLTDEHGDEIEVGDIIAFEYDSKLESRPQRIRGVYFDDKEGSGYYTDEGESLQRAFLPAPLKYRRISSRFTNKRFHPILKRWRSHRGVDYAAASGTPVHATADGIVTRVANERGYGKVIMLQHFNIYTTVYAHLRAFRKGIKRGKRVKQGDVIGYVGQTGLATGPHLHYEFRIRGKHKNPLSAILPKQLPALKDKPLARFQQYSNALFSELDSIAIRT